jgi:hypothetical protein
MQLQKIASITIKMHSYISHKTYQQYKRRNNNMILDFDIYLLKNIIFYCYFIFDYFSGSHFSGLINLKCALTAVLL